MSPKIPTRHFWTLFRMILRLLGSGCPCCDVYDRLFLRENWKISESLPQAARQKHQMLSTCGPELPKVCSVFMRISTVCHIVVPGMFHTYSNIGGRVVNKHFLLQYYNSKFPPTCNSWLYFHERTQLSAASFFEQMDERIFSYYSKCLQFEGHTYSILLV